MARYRKIDPRIWNDAKFRSLSDNGKLVFLMVLTHPSMTALGAMRSTIAGLAEELNWTHEAFREAFGEALSQGMLEHDHEACLIALPNFLKYNRPESPNVVRAWADALDLLPECALKTRVIARSKAFTEGLNEGFQKAFTEACGHPSPNQEQEQEQEKDMSGKPDPAHELLDYLNQKAGKRFRHSRSSLEPIRARLKEATSDEIRAVIDDRVRVWAGDAKMAEYLRPETIFNPRKFNGYLGNLGTQPEGSADPAPWETGI